MFFTYVERFDVADLAISSSAGNSASIDSAGANLPTVVQDDYINIQGATNPENNGIWQVTDASPTTSQFDADKMDTNVTVVDETAFVGTIADNPVDSPDALIVDDNGGSPIEGNVSSSQIVFDFDYDGNVQGGRTPSEDVQITLRAIGLETAQFIEATGVITQNTGLSFTLTASLERNYENL
jgi:hypothetical protein